MTIDDIARDRDKIREVIDFWRGAAARWFSKDPAFDASFRTRFAALYETARDGRLDTWAASPRGCLALIILLDQYPRNAFRGMAQMYATDDQARRMARLADERGFIGRVPPELRLFMILPFAHSEQPEDQDRSVELHRQFVPSGLQRAKRHRLIVARFGRFPHRNRILARISAPMEVKYLRDGGFQG